MFSAIGRYFRAFFLLITGNINSARRALMTNSVVVEATYDDIVKEKTNSVRKFKDAVARMIAQNEEKREKHKEIIADIERYTQLKNGAQKKAQSLVAKYNGDTARVKLDPDYAKCLAAFKDFSSTLTEKEKLAEEFENGIADRDRTISEHKTSITSLMREIDKIKSEKHETVAEIISAKEEQEIHDMMSGISQTDHSKDLQELRDLRREAKAKATMSREMSGLSNKNEENDFLSFAESSKATDEFDALIGLGKESAKDFAEKEFLGENKLPE